jgi:hypothetical protein
MPEKRTEKGGDEGHRRGGMGGFRVGAWKLQNPNSKQITMTEILNSRLSYHLIKREVQICLGHLSRASRSND